MLGEQGKIVITHIDGFELLKLRHERRVHMVLGYIIKK